MRPSRRVSSRLVSLLVATTLTPAAQLAHADPQPGGAHAVVNQALGEDPAPASLSRGSRGAEVTKLQERINKDRRLKGAVAIAEDGDFGPETVTALETYQRHHGLAITGVADAATWQRLEAGESETPGTTPQAQAPAPSSEPAGAAPAPNAPVRGTVQAIETLSVPDSRGSASDSAASRRGSTTPGTVWHAPMRLSNASLDALARIIEAESGVCSLEGKIAVGAVVLNRVRAGYADGTVIGVIKESAQFSGYGDAVYRGKPSADARLAALRAASGEDPSHGAYYYYNPFLVHPSWAKTMKETARIGNGRVDTHRFMKP